MIKVSAYYSRRDGCRFDFDYYCRTHLPMVRDRLGAACRGIAVDRGVAGGAPGSASRFVAVAHLYFDSTAAFDAAFGPHAEAILADVPNYTDLSPEIEFSEVLLNATRTETGDLHLHGI